MLLGCIGIVFVVYFYILYVYEVIELLNTQNMRDISQHCHSLMCFICSTFKKNHKGFTQPTHSPTKLFTRPLSYSRQWRSINPPIHYSHLLPHPLTITLCGNFTPFNVYNVCSSASFVTFLTAWQGRYGFASRYIYF